MTLQSLIAASALALSAADAALAHGATDAAGDPARPVAASSAQIRG